MASQSDSHYRTILKIVLILSLCMFCAGLVLTIIGYYFSARDMQLNSKTLSGSVSTLVVVGVIQMFLPILMVFVGPALAKRISGQK